MKSRLTFLFISTALVALLAVCAWFTMRIFETNLAVDEFQPAVPVQPGEPGTTIEDHITAPPPPGENGNAKDTIPGSRSGREAKRPEKDDAGSKTGEGVKLAGRAIQVSGLAFKVKASGAQEKLSVNGQIFLNDQIETGPQSRLTIEFIDKTHISLGENTACTIDEYLFDSDNAGDNCFSMRLFKGVCRVVTGLITTLNPGRFRVETRMATIGIRGCDLGFKVSGEQEKILVLGLGSKEAVVVSSAEDCSPVREILTRKPVEDINITPVVVTDPGCLITLTKGLGRSVRPLDAADLRDFTIQVSPLKSAFQAPKVDPGRTVFTISPGTRDEGGDKSR